MELSARDTSNRQSLRARLADLLDARAAATAAILFTLFVSGLAYVQFGAEGLAGNDGYYHMKMGYLLRTEGLKLDFPYLPLTILNESAFYDHHLLYHAFLALFATVDPALDGGAALTLGAKWASIVMPALAFLAFWWLLRAQKVPYAPLWAVGLLGISEAFLYRMSMPRAQSMSLLLLFIGAHLLLTGRFRWLAPLGFLYVWAYNAFPLLLVVGGTYLIAVLMLERRLVWQAVAFPALGIVLGLVINPYFPENITFILGHLAPKLGESSTRVGNEWDPYQTWTLIRNSSPALAAFLLGALALGWSEKRIDVRALFGLGLAILFGFMLFQSRRFVEYFPPFALLFLALSAAPLLTSWRSQLQQRDPWLTYALPLAMALLLAYPLYHSLQDGRELVSRSRPADRYADAAIWLHDNAPGATVFQTDWDDFTRLIFYNSDAVYTAGLDPTFMELQDPQLFDEWVDITRGRVDFPSQVIAEKFNGDYVFTDLNHEGFLDEAEDDPNLVEVYRDEYAAVFRVVSAEGN